MRRVGAIAATNTVRMFRVRTNFFFVFVFPMLLTLILGATFGGSATPRLGIVSHGSGPLEAALLRQLHQTPHLHVVGVGGTASLTSQVARQQLDAGLFVPPGYDANVTAGRNVTLDYYGRLDQSSQQLSETVQGAVAKQATLLGAARFAVAEKTASSFAAGLARATAALPGVPVLSITQSTAGKAKLSATLGQFDESAWTELLLFLFLIALSGALTLIETRRLGLSRRMLATPTPVTAIIAGETLSRVLVGVVQAAVIIFGSSLLFGVKWGQPLGVAAVVIVFLLVSSGAGTFLGTLFRKEQQAMGFSLLAGLGLAALGGCMVPLEVFSPAMKHVAHITPHAWANDAFAKLVAHGASITDIGSQLAVLASFAAALLALSTWRLRRVLSA
jgi:ABC-2 type transport system permease protein